MLTSIRISFKWSESEVFTKNIEDIHSAHFWFQGFNFNSMDNYKSTKMQIQATILKVNL